MSRICKILIVCLVTLASCEEESDQDERQTTLSLPPVSRANNLGISLYIYFRV